MYNCISSGETLLTLLTTQVDRDQANTFLTSRPRLVTGAASALDLSPPLTVIMTALSSDTVGSLDWLAYRLLRKLNISYLTVGAVIIQETFDQNLLNLFIILLFNMFLEAF